MKISFFPILGAIHLVAVILIIAGVGVVFLGLYWVYSKLFQKLDISVDSDWKIKPPNTLNRAVTITYAVTTSYNKRGKRVTEPYSGAEITFSLTGPDATVDGSQTKKITTGATGEASVQLAPVQNGTDTLNVHLKAGLKEGDETPIKFETVHP